MAGSGNTITIPVAIEILQSSIANVKSILGSLKPNTSGFKAMEKVLDRLTAQSEKLQHQLSQPFGSQQQFNSAERTMSQLQESLLKAQDTIKNIKFSDIQLTPDQTSQLQSLEKEIQAITKSYNELVNTTKQKLFGEGTSNRSFLETQGFSVSVFSGNLDKIITEVDKYVANLNAKASQAQEAYNKLYSQAQLSERARTMTSGGGITRETLGENLFNQYLQDTMGKVGLKEGVSSQQFIAALEQAFTLDPGTLKSLVGKPFEQINQEIAQMSQSVNNPFQAIIDSFSKADTKKLLTTKADLDSVKQILEQFKNIQNQYKDAQSNVLGPAADSMKTSVDSARQSIENMHNTMAQGVQASSQFNGGIQTSISTLNNFRDTLSQVNAQWLIQQRQMMTFNSIKMAITNFMGFTQVLNLVKTGVRNAINHIKELDTVMNGISIVTDMSTADLWNQVEAYSDMAQRYGVTIKGAYEVSQIYYQQGLDTADVMTMTNETLKLSKISGLDYAKATDYMTTAIRGFKMEMSDASTVVDVYSALAANTAVSQEELATAMSKTASSMQNVGSSFEEASAMIATMVAVTRESATNIGSALKSIASRYGELTKDPKALLDSEGEAMSFNKVDAALQSVGISMKTVDGQFREFTDVIIELGEKWNELDSTQQRYIATQFAGNRQQSRFLALVSNVDLLKSNISVAENSEDTGTVQSLKALDSIESKLNQVQVAYQQFYTTVGAEGLFKGALTGITQMINSLNSLPKLFGKIPIGAISMIYDIVQVIKMIGMDIATGIMQMWNQIASSDGPSQTAQTMGQRFGSTLKAVLTGSMNEIKSATRMLFRSDQVADTLTRKSQQYQGQGIAVPPTASTELHLNTEPGKQEAADFKAQVESQPAVQKVDGDIEGAKNKAREVVNEINSQPNANIKISTEGAEESKAKLEEVNAEKEKVINNTATGEVQLDATQPKEQIEEVKMSVDQLIESSKSIQLVDPDSIQTQIDTLAIKATELFNSLNGKQELTPVEISSIQQTRAELDALNNSLKGIDGVENFTNQINAAINNLDSIPAFKALEIKADVVVDKQPEIETKTVLDTNKITQAINQLKDNFKEIRSKVTLDNFEESKQQLEQLQQQAKELQGIVNDAGVKLGRREQSALTGMANGTGNYTYVTNNKDLDDTIQKVNDLKSKIDELKKGPIELQTKSEIDKLTKEFNDLKEKASHIDVKFTSSGALKSLKTDMASMETDLGKMIPSDTVFSNVRSGLDEIHAKMAVINSGELSPKENSQAIDILKAKLAELEQQMLSISKDGKFESIDAKKLVQDINATRDALNGLETGTIKVKSKLEGLGSVASGLNMLASLFNNGSRSGQILSGSIMGIAGALRVVDGLIKGISTGSGFMAVAMGIVSLVNGISTAIETQEEKIERLTKEAQELSDTAKTSRSNYKNLDKSLKDLAELEKKRYDGAEAAEAYQTAVDDLTDKFPELIAGFDATNNIIFDTVNAEAVLAAARQKAAEAAMAAAEKELELNSEKRKESEEKVKREVQFIGGTAQEENAATPIVAAPLFKQLFEAYIKNEIPKLSNLFSDTFYASWFNNDRKYTNGTLTSASQLDTSMVEQLENLSFDSSNNILQAFRELKELNANYLALIEDQGDAADDKMRYIAEAWQVLDKFDIDWEGNYAEQEALQVLKQLYNSTQDASTFEGTHIQQAVSLIHDVLQDYFNNSLLSYTDNVERAALDLSKASITDADFDDKVLTLTDALNNYKTAAQKAFPGDNAAYDRFYKTEATLKELKTQYNNYINNTALEEGNLKTLASAWQQANLNNIKAQNTYTNSTGLLTLVSNQMADYVKTSFNGSWEDAKKDSTATSKFKEYQKVAQEFYDQLDADEAKEFDNRINNLDNYGRTDILSIVDSQNFDQERKEQLEQWIEEYYSAREEFLQSQLKLAASSKGITDTRMPAQWAGTELDFAGQYYTAIESVTRGIERDFLDATATEYASMRKEGYTDTAENYGKARMALYNAIFSDEENYQAYYSAISAQNLNTAEGITNAITAVKALGIDSTVVEKALEEFNNYITSHLSLSIQSIISNATDSWKDNSATLSKLTSGIDLADVENVIANAASFGDKDFSLNFSDFTSVGDKLTLSQKAAEEYWAHFFEQQRTQANTVKEQFENAGKNVAPRLKVQDISEIAIDEDFYKSLSTILEGDIDKFISVVNGVYSWKEGVDINGLNAAIAKHASSMKISFDNAQQIFDWQEKQIRQSSEWMQGKYGNIIKEANISEAQWRALIKGDYKGDIKDLYTKIPDLKNAVQNAQNAYSTVLSDLLSKGFDYVNQQTYDYIDSDIVSDISHVAETVSYEQAVSEYIQNAGKSLEEANDLIMQAIAKDREGLAADYIKDLHFINDHTLTMSSDELSTFASRTGQNVEDIIRSGAAYYNETLKTYVVDLNNATLADARHWLTGAEGTKVDLKNASDEFRNAVSEATRKLYSDIISAISNGIRGKLSIADFEQLKFNLQAVGADVSGLDFKETASGLQLTEKSIFKIYTELKAIDGLQAQQLLPEISKMSDQYSNLENACKRYNDLIHSNTKALVEEKIVLQDLIKSMMTTPESYNFMSGSLPTEWQYAQNYASNMQTALKAVQEGAKKSFMSLSDFYNLVTASGAYNPNFQVGGLNADQLIRAAGEHMQFNSKGELGIDLKNFIDTKQLYSIYNQLVDGLEFMTASAETYYDISDRFGEISDAMHRIEPIDFSAIFPKGKSVDRGEFEQYFSDLKASMPTLIEDMHGISIGGKQLSDLMSDGAWSEWSVAGFNEESFTKFWTGLGEIDWSDATKAAENVAKLLTESGINKPITYKTDKTFAVIEPSGNAIKVDFNDKKAEAAAKQAWNDTFGSGKNGEKAKKPTQEFIDQLNAEATKNPESGELNYVLAVAQGKIDVKKFKGNDKNGWTYEYNGKTFTAGTKAALAGLLGKQIFLDNEGFADFEYDDTDNTTKITATKYLSPSVQLKYNEDGTYTLFSGNQPIDTYTSYAEAIKAMVKKGLSKDVGKVIEDDDGTSQVIMNKTFGFTYTVHHGENGDTYSMDGHDFNTWKDLYQYMATKNQAAQFGGSDNYEDTKVDGKVTTRIFHLEGGADLIYDFTNMTIRYEYQGIPLTGGAADWEEIRKLQGKEGLDETIKENADGTKTVTWTYKEGEAEITVTYDKGGFHYVCEFPGGTVEGESEEEIKQGLALLGIGLQGGEVPPGQDGQITYTSTKTGIKYLIDLKNGTVTVEDKSGELDGVTQDQIDKEQANLENDTKKYIEENPVEVENPVTLYVKKIKVVMDDGNGNKPKTETEGKTDEIPIEVDSAKLVPKDLKVDTSNVKTEEGTNKPIEIPVANAIINPTELNLNTDGDIALGVSVDQDKLNHAKNDLSDLSKAISSVQDKASIGIDVTLKVEDSLIDQLSKISTLLKEIAANSNPNVKVTGGNGSKDGGNSGGGTPKAGVPNVDTSGVEAAATAINSIKATAAKNAAAALNNITISGQKVDATANVIVRIFSAAKGNMGDAFASGTQTLMGELGPELVVTQGRYFIAGQSGAEFVNLDKDAIVFNHRQTARLMEKGAIGSRGKPFTNETNAIALAKGFSPTGPARKEAQGVRGEDDDGLRILEKGKDYSYTYSLTPSNGSAAGHVWDAPVAEIKVPSAVKGNIPATGNAMSQATGTPKMNLTIGHANQNNPINTDAIADAGLTDEQKSKLYSLIQQAITDGFDNIDWDQYKEDLAKILGDLKEHATGSYREFVARYRDNLKETVSKINELYFSAWQADLAAIGQSEDMRSALANLTFFGNGSVGGSSADWVKLFGNKISVIDLVDQKIIEYNAALGQYVVTNWDKLKEMLKKEGIELDENYLNAVMQDSANTMIKTIGDYLKQALEGTLSNVDLEKLNAYLRQNGLSEIPANAVTQTAEGVIVSIQQLQKLAEEIRNKPNLSQSMRDQLTATIQDSINATISTVSDLISKGMSGTLSNSDLAKLNAFLRENNLSEIASDAITQTANGVIISIERLQQLAAEIAKSKKLSNDVKNRLTASIQDAIRETANTISDLINKGIEGTLSHADLNSLNDLLRANGLAEVTNNMWSETSTGIKLTLAGAATLYEQLKKISGTAAQITLKKLIESLMTSNDHYKTMASTLERIKELQEKIANADRYSDEKIRQYKQELELAKEIAATRATSEDESMNFLNANIPGALNNPTNYIQSWITGMQELIDATNQAEDATRAGTVSYQHLYNMAMQMNQMAAVTGESLTFLGHTLDGTTDSFTNFMLAAANALGSDDNGNFGVQIANMMNADVSDMSEGIDSAIHEMARQQIEIIDAYIKIFEVIVAMEEFEKVDKDKNGLLDYSEIFKKNSEEFTKNFKKAAKNLLEAAESNEQLKAALESVTLNGHTIKELLEDALDGVFDMADMTKEEYAQAMSVIYEAFASGDFDLDNIAQSLLEKFRNNQSNFKGQLQLGDMIIDFAYGVKVKKKDNGKFEGEDGKEYDTLEQAIRMSAIQNIDRIENIKWHIDTQSATGQINIENETIDITIDESGTHYMVGGKPYKTLADAYYAIWKKLSESGQTNLSFSDWAQQMNITITPNIEIDTSHMSNQQIDNLIGMSVEDLKKAWDEMTHEEFEATYGFRYDNTMTDQWLQDLKTKLGIENKRMELAIDIRKLTGLDDALKEFFSKDGKGWTLNLNTNVSADVSELAKSISSSISDAIKTAIESVSANFTVTVTGGASAKGNVALAKGTLMGELGPELVVSGGRYWVAGQGGAEFVNLPNDAIVFNHLQTQSLLNKGSTSRGKPVKSEAASVAMAYGTTGIAMASAKETLATLKQLKAMWESLLNASINDLVKVPSTKDSSNSTSDPKYVAALVAEVERWYNLLQKIAQLEKEITSEQKKRTELESSRIANGMEYYKLQLSTLENYRQQAAAQKELAITRQQYFNRRRAELNANSPFAQFYEYDENGQIKFKDGSFQLLNQLVGTNEQGETNYTVKEQYEIMKDVFGLGEFMEYKSDGTKIEMDSENVDQFYKDSVQAVWDRMDSEKEEMQALHDSIIEANDSYYDLINEANGILTAILENQRSVEDNVLQAIEDREQATIDALSKERDALQKSYEDYTNGLTNALNKERDMYKRQDDQAELISLRRQLAILQRSGASASSISQIQDSLQTKERDAYFQAQQDSIDAVKEAADLQLEQLKNQVELMKETLEYEKQNGLLWDDVYAVMSGSSEEIAEFIAGNTADWGSKSALAKSEDMLTLMKSLQQWVAYRDKDYSDIFGQLEKSMNWGFQATVDSLAASNITNTEVSITQAQDLEPLLAELLGITQTNVSSNNNLNDRFNNSIQQLGLGARLEGTSLVENGSSNFVSAAVKPTDKKLTNYSTASGEMIRLNEQYSNSTNNSTIPPSQLYQQQNGRGNSALDTLLNRYQQIKEQPSPVGIVEFSDEALTSLQMMLEEALAMHALRLESRQDGISMWDKLGLTEEEYKQMYGVKRSSRQNRMDEYMMHHPGEENNPMMEMMFNQDGLQMYKEKSPAIAALEEFTNSVTNQYNSFGNMMMQMQRDMNGKPQGFNMGDMHLNMNVTQMNNDYEAAQAGRRVMEEMLRVARENGYNRVGGGRW